MSASTLKIDVAGVLVEVRSELAWVTRALEAMWRPALTTQGTPRFIFEVGKDGSVARDGVTLSPLADREQLMPFLEGEMLALLGQQMTHALMLHAGAVLFEEMLILLVGEANSGKSSVTRALLRQGGQYLTDDSLSFDQGVCRGLARSIHFDSILVDAPVPAYLRDCDLTSYRFSGRDGRTWATPVWLGSFESIHEHIPRTDGVVLVTLERGSVEKIDTISRLERVAALIGASLTVGTSHFGMVPSGPSFRLIWNRDPEAAVAQLIERIRVGRKLTL